MRLLSSSLSVNQRNIPFLSSSQIECDSLLESFSEQASDWRQLFAMTAGSFAFQSVRALGSAAGFGNVLFSGLALGGEAAVFGGVNRVLSSREEVSGTFFENWKRDFVQFGIMKAVGNVLATQNPFLRHGVSSLGMMWGSEATARLGWTPQENGTFSQRLIHGMAMSVALEVGSNLFGMASGNVLERVGRNLEFGNQIRECARLSHPESASSGQMIHWMSSEENFDSHNEEIKNLTEQARINSRHFLRRLWNGSVTGLRLGSLIGFFAGGILGGLVVFADFAHGWGNGPLWINLAFMFFGTGLGMTMGMLFGAQLGGGVGLLTSFVLTTRRLIVERFEQVSWFSTNPFSYRNHPALNSEYFSHLEAILENTQVSVSEKLQRLHNIPDSLDIQACKALLKILQRRLLSRSTESEAKAEDVLDLALFSKIGRQPKSVVDSVKIDYAIITAQLSPLLREYGASQGKAGDEVAAELAPYLMYIGLNPMLYILASLSSNSSYRDGRLGKAMNVLHLFSVLSVVYFPVLSWGSIINIINVFMGVRHFGEDSTNVPNINLSPEFRAALQSFHEIFMKKPEITFSAEEAEGTTRVRVVDEKQKIAKVLPRAEGEEYETREVEEERRERRGRRV